MSNHIPTDANADQIAYWNDRAGLTWTREQARIDAVFAPLTAMAVDAAAPAEGEAILDVGCGCGETVLALARRVGPSGRVVGLDVSEPMAGRARERVAEAGLAQAEIVIADAATYRPDVPFDAVFSRFGVMFFADPVAAFANLRRAARPGGRLTFAAWRPLAENPWFGTALQAARPLLPPEPPPQPDAPGPFAFADADRVHRILCEAGWSDVAFTPREAAMRLGPPGDIAEATRFCTRVGPLARALAEADDSLRERVRDAVAQALAAHDGPDGVSLGGAIWIVSARA